MHGNISTIEILSPDTISPVFIFMRSDPVGVRRAQELRHRESSTLCVAADTAEEHQLLTRLCPSHRLVR